ncbi:LytR/AlgR family response regulator transcription factor [Chryseobacterium sp. A321]
MKKDRLYLWSLLALSLIVFLIGYVSINYLIKLSTEEFLSIQIESSKREAKEMARLVSTQIEAGASNETIISNVQKSIEDTESEAGFLCMFDANGKEVCHPNPSKIGEIVKPSESFVSVGNGLSKLDFYHLLNDKKEGGGIRDFENSPRKSEIIYLYPVKNSEFIMAAHANLDLLHQQISTLKRNFFMVYGGTSLLMVLLSLFSVRLIGSSYEKELESRNEKLSQEVVTLSKLNKDIELYREKLIKDPVDPHSSKNRILTNKADQLVPLEVSEIGFIFTDHSITYISTLDGRSFTSNSSLEELLKTLDSRMFFRANRRFIISVNGIEKVIKYGNSQLKIEMRPSCQEEILISKNKAAEFKQWLGS